jgi:hypothetical protein
LQHSLRAGPKIAPSHTSWASRNDRGRVGEGSWAWTRARASRSPAAYWRPTFFACLRRDSNDA